MTAHTRIRPAWGLPARLWRALRLRQWMTTESLVSISGVGDADAAIVRMEKLRCSRLQTKLDAHLAAIKKSYGWRVVDIERELRGTGVQRTGARYATAGRPQNFPQAG